MLNFSDSKIIFETFLSIPGENGQILRFKNSQKCSWSVVNLSVSVCPISNYKSASF